ncbi:MAG: hypothetical protein Q4E18_10070, partial [Clostridia bacterium]|nr:hypothetical protein [Clostridia bacterium]
GSPGSDVGTFSLEKAGFLLRPEEPRVSGGRMSGFSRLKSCSFVASGWDSFSTGLNAEMLLHEKSFLCRDWRGDGFPRDRALHLFRLR